jgi:tRNA (guanine-N7-)-methyltransferase
MPEQTKVMGKDWADARREGSVDRLRLTLQTALADQTMITFELGCGHGHWLAAYGAAHPAEYCVGIDLVTHRVERSQRKQALGKLTNVVFLKAEATEFLDALLPTQQLAKVFILYPDPWPKKRHQKNRFINAANLDRLADHAIAGATLHFRTDSEAYHAWTREHLAAHPRWQLVEGTPWPFERTTFFEDMMKAKRDLLAVCLP